MRKTGSLKALLLLHGNGIWMSLIECWACQVEAELLLTYQIACHMDGLQCVIFCNGGMGMWGSSRKRRAIALPAPCRAGPQYPHESEGSRKYRVRKRGGKACTDERSAHVSDERRTSLCCWEFVGHLQLCKVKLPNVRMLKYCWSILIVPAEMNVGAQIWHHSRC